MGVRTCAFGAELAHAHAYTDIRIASWATFPPGPMWRNDKLLVQTSRVHGESASLVEDLSQTTTDKERVNLPQANKNVERLFVTTEGTRQDMLLQTLGSLAQQERS